MIAHKVIYVRACFITLHQPTPFHPANGPQLSYTERHQTTVIIRVWPLSLIFSATEIL